MWFHFPLSEEMELEVRIDLRLQTIAEPKKVLTLPTEDPAAKIKNAMKHAAKKRNWCDWFTKRHKNIDEMTVNQFVQELTSTCKRYKMPQRDHLHQRNRVKIQQNIFNASVSSDYASLIKQNWKIQEKEETQMKWRKDSMRNCAVEEQMYCPNAPDCMLKYSLINEG